VGMDGQEKERFWKDPHDNSAFPQNTYVLTSRACKHFRLHSKRN
jgi:hypothetical protein